MLSGKKVTELCAEAGLSVAEYHATAVFMQLCLGLRRKLDANPDWLVEAEEGEV